MRTSDIATTTTPAAGRCRILPILIVGVGSPHADDQLGWLVAQRLRQQTPDHCQVRLAANPLELLDWTEDCSELHVIDACHGNQAAGTIYRWAWPSPEIQNGYWAGTHDFNLSGVLALANQLNLLPPTVIVWGIERDRQQIAGSVSTAAAIWIAEIVERIQREISTTSSLSNAKLLGERTCTKLP